MAKILPFTGITFARIEPTVVLEGAKDKLKEVLVIGWDLNDELYVASSTSYLPEILFLLEKVRADMVSSSEGED